MAVMSLAALTSTKAAPTPFQGSVPSAIIGANQATGFLTTENYNYFPNTGALALCFNPRGCEPTEWESLAGSVKKRFPKATYVGFQLLETRYGLRIVVYYNLPQ